MNCTNNLMDILEYKNNIFLNSFLKDVIRMEVGNITEVVITPMETASNLTQEDGSSTDFSDFLIKFKNDGVPQFVIIVIRINDVKDMKHQIDRYVHNALGEKMEFEKWIGDPAMHCAYDDEYYNMRLVYITNSRKKQPSRKSLTWTLKNNIGSSYIPISYTSTILPWMKAHQSS